jgi:hypothetical protein
VPDLGHDRQRECGEGPERPGGEQRPDPDRVCPTAEQITAIAIDATIVAPETRDNPTAHRARRLRG